MNLREDPGFLELSLTIGRHAGDGQVDFFPSPGNWGDALITRGSITFLESIGIDFRTIHREALSTERLIPARTAVVGGGGGWCRAWSSTPGFVKTVAAIYDQVVVLPTTFDVGVSPLEGSNVTYFTRDRSIDPTVASFCPDMAFFLDFEADCEPIFSHPLVCLRRDRERHSSSIDLDRNWDLSQLGNASSEVRELVTLISRFPIVYTDRLHIAIAGGMLGRRVFLLEGSYPKNRGVYEATMKHYLPNVSMMSWGQFKRDPVISPFRRVASLRRRLPNLRWHPR